jgi:hypothetical protein
MEFTEPLPPYRQLNRSLSKPCKRRRPRRLTSVIGVTYFCEGLKDAGSIRRFTPPTSSAYVALHARVNLTNVTMCGGALRHWTTATPGPKWMIADTLVPIDIRKAEMPEAI